MQGFSYRAHSLLDFSYRRSLTSRPPFTQAYSAGQALVPLSAGPYFSQHPGHEVLFLRDAPDSCHLQRHAETRRCKRVRRVAPLPPPALPPPATLPPLPPAARGSTCEEGAGVADKDERWMDFRPGWHSHGPPAWGKSKGGEEGKGANESGSSHAGGWRRVPL